MLLSLEGLGLEPRDAIISVRGDLVRSVHDGRKHVEEEGSWVQCKGR